MALLTSLPVGDATTLLEAFGLTLHALTPLEAGSVNSNFFLEASSLGSSPRQLFARIYEEQGEEGARFELLVNEALHAAGLPVARPVRRSDGSLFALFAGKPFAVYERLDGEVVCQQRVTPAITRSVGTALARVHQAPLGDLKPGASRFNFDGIERRLDQVRKSQREDLRPAVDRLATLTGELRTARSGDLPQGLIHGDLFRDNVLVRGNEVVGLLDFESASRGPYVFDLMVTLLAWCFGDRLDPLLVRAFLEGYVSVRPLEGREQEALVVEGSVACVRFATTRLTDFSLRVAEGERPTRDYRRFFERLDALTSGQLKSAISGVF